MTMLNAATVLADVVGKKVLAEQLLPSVLAMAKDPVPNVRFNVAKTLQAISSKLDDAVVAGEVKSCLTTLVADSDEDVQFYAQRALDNKY